MKYGEAIRSDIYDAAFALGELVEDLLDVLGALAKWRRQDTQHVETVVQILAKRAMGHHGLEVAMRGCDDAHVDEHVAAGAYGSHESSFDRTEEFGLEIA